MPDIVRIDTSRLKHEVPFYYGEGDMADMVRKVSTKILS